VESLESGTQNDPAVLERLKARAKVFTLNEAQTLTLDLSFNRRAPATGLTLPKRLDMPISAPFRRIFTPLAAALAGGLAFAYTLAHPAGLAAAGGPPANNDDKSISHVLDRLGYGPRPGDVEKVRQVGVMNYIDQQLHPEKIDDSALEARLAPLKTIDLSSREIARDYYQPAQVQKRQQKTGRGKSGPGRPLRRP
jgi:hypothetical protein